MLALSEYTETTSLQRVLFVCVATPFPMFSLIMLQELIPLQNPHEGWQANYGFWIRYGILAGTVAASMAVHATIMIDSLSLTKLQIATLTLIMGVSFPFFAMLVAELWGFPLPFIALLLETPFMIETLGVFYLLVGGDVVRQILTQRYQCVQFFNFITIQMILSLVYPAYQVLFSAAASTSYELPVILLLPVIKLVMKNVLSLTIPHLEDMLPLEVIFCVDFFNAFYLVTCVQSASSTSAVVTILAVDISQSTLELYRLYRRTRNIAAKLTQALDQGSTNTLLLLNAVQTLCETPGKLDSHLHSGIRLRSSSVLQTQRNNWLGNVERRRESEARGSLVSPDASMIVQASTRDRAEFQNVFQKCISRSKSTVQPISVMPVKPLRSDQVPEATPSFLAEALEVLFTSECLVLTEYLEAVIPVVYGCYVKILVTLPSAQYHIELEGTAAANVDSRVQSVFVYAALEFASLGILVLVLMKNCGVRALHQLAFVLETQMKVVQTKLIVWAIITLCFRVVHFGTARASLDGSSRVSLTLVDGRLVFF